MAHLLSVILYNGYGRFVVVKLNLRKATPHFGAIIIYTSLVPQLLNAVAYNNEACKSFYFA